MSFPNAFAIKFLFLLLLNALIDLFVCLSCFFDLGAKPSGAQSLLLSLCSEITPARAPEDHIGVLGIIPRSDACKTSTLLSCTISLAHY